VPVCWKLVGRQCSWQQAWRRQQHPDVTGCLNS
jgi:hypothetical protein